MQPNYYYALFNGVDIDQLRGVTIYSIDPYTLPNRQHNVFPLARRSGQKISSSFYVSRTINLGIYINGVNKADAEKILDSLYSIIQTTEATLTLPQSGMARNYIASYNSQTINSQSGGFLDISFNFICSDSFGYDTNYTVINPKTTYASGNLTFPYTQGGTADIQLPHIEIKFLGATPVTGTVTVGNQNTGQVINITNTFNQYDIIKIDTKDLYVRINDVDVAFTGSFPEMGLGLQTLYYLDTFTSRSIELFAYVYNRYT